MTVAVVSNVVVGPRSCDLPLAFSLRAPSAQQCVVCTVPSKERRGGGREAGQH